MQFVRTLAWLVCVIYSTVPLFWLMVHPRAHIWRERERSPFRVLVPAWIVMWFGVGALTEPWRVIALYSTNFTWIPAVLLFAAGFFLYSRAGAHFSWAQLGGLPEVRPGEQEQRLVTTGIRSRVRHPVYLGHLCEMLAWSMGTGLLVCWLLTAFAIATGAVMIRMEDAELEMRFGDEFRKYRSRVPAVLPITISAEKDRLSIDGVCIRHEVHGKTAWQVAIADLVCIAEYTDSGGPMFDDYFLVFVAKNGLFCDASFYSDGRDTTLVTLGAALGSDLRLGLIQSTTFASRIIWPKELEGTPFFVEKDVNPEVKRLIGVTQL